MNQVAAQIAAQVAMIAAVVMNEKIHQTKIWN
jgi:hypothetical protein